jgi:hypothetical protein
MKVIFLLIRKLMTVLMHNWFKRFDASLARRPDKPAQARRQRPAVRQAKVYSFEAYIQEKKRARQQARSIQPQRALAVPESESQRPPRNSREEWRIRCDKRKSSFQSSA